MEEPQDTPPPAVKKPRMRRSWINGKGYKPPTVVNTPGYYTLELGITPRLTYTRPAVGEERFPVHGKSTEIYYETITYFLNPFLTWLDDQTVRTGRCSCTGYQTQKKWCKHLTEAKALALPYKHLLELNSCEPDDDSP